MQERNGPIRVILSAGNISHYHHTALALQQAGYLYKYFCVFDGVNDLRFTTRLLPEKFRKRLADKTQPSLDSTKIRTFAVSYLFTQILHRLKIIDQGKVNALFGSLYDRDTLPNLGEANVFHFVNSMGLRSAQRMKKEGGIVICDVRAEHVDYQDALLRSECNELGLTYRSTRRLIRDRLIAEYQLADALFVPSSHVLESLTQFGVPRNKIFVVPYGVSFSRLTNQVYHRSQDKTKVGSPFCILFVGQVIPRKGIHYLIQAFVNLNLPNSELLIVGQGEPGYLEVLEKIGMNNGSVKFLGHVPHVELWKYYQEADIFVLPTLSEGSALVVYEAMAAGLPVITTQNAGAVIQNGVDGFIVPIRDAETLQEKIVYLYEHPRERRILGGMATSRAREYTWERYGERLLNAYEQVLAHKGI